MAVTKLPIEMIVSDPAVRSGQPIIDGTGIAVADLAAYHTNEDQMSPEELAENFNLSMGQVYAALAYYFSHQDEIMTAIRENETAMDAIAQELKAQGKLISLD